MISDLAYYSLTTFSGKTDDTCCSTIAFYSNSCIPVMHFDTVGYAIYALEYRVHNRPIDALLVFSFVFYIKDLYTWQSMHDWLIQACFFFLHFSGYQTLGEEYVNIVQVDPTKRRVPSLTRRGAFVLFHTFAPYLLDKLLVCLENELQAEDRPRAHRDSPSRWNPMFYIKAWVQQAVGALSENQRKNLVPVLYACQQGITIVHRIHVAVFYIYSSFYHISRRATGISYVSWVWTGSQPKYCQPAI